MLQRQATGAPNQCRPVSPLREAGSALELKESANRQKTEHIHYMRGNMPPGRDVQIYTHLWTQQSSGGIILKCIALKSS